MNEKEIEKEVLGWVDGKTTATTNDYRECPKCGGNAEIDIFTLNSGTWICHTCDWTEEIKESQNNFKITKKRGR